VRAGECKLRTSARVDVSGNALTNDAQDGAASSSLSVTTSRP
jgi:hypothetical protein